MAITRRIKLIALLGMLLTVLGTLSFVYHDRVLLPRTVLRTGHKHGVTTTPDQLPLSDPSQPAAKKVSKGDGDNDLVLSADGRTPEPVEDEADELDDDEDESDTTATEAADDTTQSTTTVDRGDYRELFSLTTRDRKYIPVHMDGKKNYNPNLIPHPTRADEWIIVAQGSGNSSVSAEMTCAVGLLNDVLVCSGEPEDVPIAKSVWGKCEGKIAYYNSRGGPRDARLFNGPDAPYIVYGSQSTYTCLGLWMQDARPLLRPFHLEESTGNKLFKSATEIKRPAPWDIVEKNFFLFWDSSGKMYAHHDIWPKRTFAALDFDGSAGENLAVKAEHADKFCMAQFMPVILHNKHSIHQATNSLWITLCNRFDPHCKPDDDNTFIMHIFQVKKHVGKGAIFDYIVYEPYVVLFKRSAPFALHAIGQKPLWIHGRQAETPQGKRDLEKRKKGPETFYVTSMSWKKHGQRYHGYIDDVLFLGFGIDDTRSAVMDVKAEDLIVDLAFC